MAQSKERLAEVKAFVTKYQNRIEYIVNYIPPHKLADTNKELQKRFVDEIVRKELNYKEKTCSRDIWRRLERIYQIEIKNNDIASWKSHSVKNLSRS